MVESFHRRHCAVTFKKKNVTAEYKNLPIKNKVFQKTLLTVFFTVTFDSTDYNVQCCNHVPKSGSAAFTAVIQPSIPPSVSSLRQVTY